MLCAKHYEDVDLHSTYTIYSDTELDCKSMLEMAVIPSCELKVIPMSVCLSYFDKSQYTEPL